MTARSTLVIARVVVALAGCMSTAISGCGSQAFDPEFAERQQPTMSGVMQDIAAAPPRVITPVIVALTREPAGLLLWDLAEGRERWRVTTDARSAPIVAGDYVVTAEAAGAVVRRIEDGAVALTIGDPQLHLIGADGEGTTAVLAFAQGEGASPLGYVVGVQGGAAAWSHELPLPVGVPAVVGSIVIVPWGHQRISMLDAADGTERLRVRLEHSVVGYAMHHGGHVYVGQHQLFRVTEGLFSDEEEHAAGLEPRGRPLPGQPPLLADAYEPRRDVDSARNRVRLAWAIDDAAGEATFADDALYFVFYRMVFGLTAAEDDVRWVQDRATDVVGTEGIPGGLIVVTADGTIAVLSATDGRTTFEASLGAEVRAAEVHAEGWQPPARESPAPDPLPAQLARAATMPDVRLGAGRALAIHYLARDGSADVTAQLVELCSDRSDSSQARTEACDRVSERTNGDPHVMTALHGSASFLEARAAPPLGALARAAATMHLRQAVPFLVGHLEDPATPIEELAGLFDGLARLGDARAVAPIERFVRLYHADATDSATIEAVGDGAEALLALDADSAADLQLLADDPLAPSPVRERLTAALTRAATVTAPVPETPAPPRRAPTPVVDTTLPVAITSEMREEIFGPLARRLHACLETPEGTDPIPSVRIMMMIDDEGAIATVSVTPAALQACIEPIVTGRSFPRTRRGREVVVHTIRR